ncbi:hypothetical protein T484DRAFT_1822675 [Baffinella frigidus]|nr:hypothetical protein T484DRAFT_1822675 [Cryptophyta sp. CCMP2293]
MGVLYLLGRDGKVFCPPQFWDGVLHDSTGGRSGTQLSHFRLAVFVAFLILTCATGFYLLETDEVCTKRAAPGMFQAFLETMGQVRSPPRPLAVD